VREPLAVVKPAQAFSGRKVSVRGIRLARKVYYLSKQGISAKGRSGQVAQTVVPVYILFPNWEIQQQIEATLILYSQKDS
jgi:hypothetical protein